MLLKSSRHKPEDLQLWQELEQGDLAHATTEGFQRRVAEAKEAIRRFRKRGLFCVWTSWGKDSVTVAHLCLQVSPDAPLIHLRPTNHNPDCDLVRDFYRKRFPKQPYLEVSVDYSDLDRTVLPEHVLDQETDKRWYAAIRKVEQRVGHRRVLGIRAEESTPRRMRVGRYGLDTGKALAPIGHWSAQDVFSYLAFHRLPVHPAYACLGGGRWRRERIRVAEIGDTRGREFGRLEWEQEYYGAELRKVQATGKC